MQPMNATTVKITKLVGGLSGVATPLTTMAVFNAALKFVMKSVPVYLPCQENTIYIPILFAH